MSCPCGSALVCGLLRCQHRICYITEFSVVSPDFFSVGAVVFLVFSVFNRVQGWFVVQSGPLLRAAANMILSWSCAGFRRILVVTIPVVGS
jgi:hypothetical protein